MPKQRPENTHSNSCHTPIYQSAMYFFKNIEEVIQYHKKVSKLGRYGRYTNPNWTAVEQRMAQLDGAADALLLTTGMTAIATTLLALVQAGDTVAFTGNCYRNTSAFCLQILPKLGITAIPINSAQPDRFETDLADACHRHKPKIIFLEAPSNPHLYLVDIGKIKNIVNDGAILIVDSTLSTPANFRPLDHGADLVIHSCTKYLSGHGDVMAGSVAGRQDLIESIRICRNIMGGIVDPHTAFLIGRSLETLTLRMAHFNQAGLSLARHLQAHPRIARVYYTGLSSHPHAHLAGKYLSGHGGIVSFDVAGTGAETTAFIQALERPYMASNFGAHCALVEQCAIFTYYNFSAQERAEQGISDSLVRLSIGYESIDLLIDDIDSALARVFG